MKVKIDFKMEILEGEDKGYILEETNRILDIYKDPMRVGADHIVPYRVNVDFVTPNLMREWREREEANNER